MEPFLYQVASEYVKQESRSLLDYCFVFPNKRSSTFFRHYLQEILAGESVIMPEITTIAAFTSSMSDLIPATRFEQLFVMYDCYRKLSEDIPDFDKFLFWGDMLISDFNDVDRYLVDPEMLFVNVKRLKEIGANYLTDEQVEIIRRYWGDELTDYDPDHFWKHVSNDENVIQDKFLKLWEILLPLFRNYCSELERRGLASEGMLLRNAVAKVKDSSEGELPFRRYIFVGFNVLSTAEVKLFETLKARGAADFYWDFNSPAFSVAGNKGARFMRRNIERFPSKYTVDTVKNTEMPEIRITCVPSKVGMVKEAGRILDEWIRDGVIDASNPGNRTAMVLPEEDLFIPMIHSVPAAIADINVTMGYPLKFTSVATLLNAITAMQLHGRMNDGEGVYLIEDVVSVLSHPLVQSMDQKACCELMSKLKANRIFLVPASMLTSSFPADFTEIFSYVADAGDSEAVYCYTRNLVDMLVRHTRDDGKRGKVESLFLEGFSAALEELHDAMGQWHISMKDSTFFHLLRRSMASASVTFNGEPLKGLQMMGVLETRSLDFDNIIMLSMNERVFPRRHFSRSFIPDTLRRAYGMSTVEFQESIYAYYFYRLISRAKRVELIYDGRTEGTNSGEMSRYLAQLLYFFPESGIRHCSKYFPAPAVDGQEISIVKTDDVMEKLGRFVKTEGDDRQCFSASSINSYINCPLNFYLKYVERLDLDDEVTDYMDSSTFGTILHQVMEEIYKDLRGKADEVKITEDVIDSVNKPHVIDRYIVEAINEHYNRKGRGCRDELTGEPLLLGRIMRRYVGLLLESEKQYAPFWFVDAERKIDTRFAVNPSLTVNIRQVIDRIDKVDGVLRVVDYKTGGDKITFSSVDDLFDSSKTDRRKAILQLMFYCNVLAMESGYDGPIQPMIYSFKSLGTEGLSAIRYNKKPFLDYREINDEFMSRFCGVLEEIFNPEVPFTQAADSHACKFCSFKPVCGKTEDDE